MKPKVKERQLYIQLKKLFKKEQVYKYGQIWKYVHPIVLSAQCRRKKMSFLSVPSLRLLCVFWGSFVSLWVGGCAFYEAMGANN